MKKFNLKILLLLIVSFLFLTFDAEAGEGEYALVDQQFKNEHSKIPSFLRFDSNNALQVGDLEEFLSQYYEKSTDFGLNALREEEDQIGFVHYVYTQTYQNIPISFSELRVHAKDGLIQSMNGTLLDKAPLKSELRLSVDDALESALNYIGAKSYKWEILEEEDHLKREGLGIDTYYPEGELTYVAPNAEINSKALRLAYKFNIYAHEPISRTEIYIDASNGEVLFTNQLIQDANVSSIAHTGHSGVQNITTDSLNSTSFRLRQTLYGSGVNTYNMRRGNRLASAVDFTNNSSVWNIANSNLDQYALDAHWGAEQTYLYFNSKFNRNSIDAMGHPLNSYVHYSQNPPLSYANAFWDGLRMVYGDGGGNIRPLTSLDIAGHEITHGLTTYTANLIYSRESGALNESFSDVFGTAIEHFGRPNQANWTIGEDIGRVLRSLSNPKLYGNPNTRGGVYWVNVNNCNPTQQNDNCGVHINSGVQNYWFYLLVNGGTGTNDKNQTYSVQGIGMDHAAAIAFRTLTVYLGRTSDYDDARFYSIQSAMDLYGACSPQIFAVEDAWHAVGVGNAHTPGIVADFSTHDVVNCTTPHQVRFRNESINATSYLWNFGNGRTSTDKDPAHLYNAYGTYDVSLIVDGGNCGKDTIIKTNLINIDRDNPCLFTLKTSENDKVTDCIGILMDNGTSVASYAPNQNSIITIEPPNASSINIKFNLFDVQAGTTSNTCDNDYLEIFDGPSTSSPSLGRFCNNNPPPASLVSNREVITVNFVTNGSVELEGFRMEWACNPVITSPTSDFTSNISNSCEGEIKFMDLSTDGPTSWEWDFGDGNTSTERNPVHTYSINGEFDVKLKATNSFGSNTKTESKMITIDRPTMPEVENDTVCHEEKATLKVNGNGNYRWYTSEFGGSMISSNSELSIEGVKKDTSLWVEQYEEGGKSTFGPNKDNPGVGSYYNGVGYLIFDVHSTITLESVYVISGAVGQRQIELRDKNGMVLQSKIVSLGTGIIEVPLNFTIPAGKDYQLGTTPHSSNISPYLYRLTQGAQFPYEVPNVVSIKGNNTGNSEYAYFFNWTVKQAECVSARAEIKAVIDTSCTSSILKYAQDKYELEVYPNPAKEVVNLSYNSNEKAERIEIYNSQGALVQEETIRDLGAGKYQVKTTNLAEGMYFLNIKFTDGVIRKQLIIMH